MKSGLAAAIGVASLARVVTPDQPPWLALGLPGSIRTLSQQLLFPVRGGLSHTSRGRVTMGGVDMVTAVGLDLLLIA